MTFKEKTIEELQEELKQCKTGNKDLQDKCDFLEMKQVDDLEMMTNRLKEMEHGFQDNNQ